MTKIRTASSTDISTIVQFMAPMQKELNEFAFDSQIASTAIARSIEENVYWFLFLDEQNMPFGTCYLQSLHNYWRAEKRFYLGGFYIAPAQRGKGLFKEVNGLLKEWAENHDGVQIYVHIHKDNGKSLGAFQTVGFMPEDYLLCVNHWGGLKH